MTTPTALRQFIALVGGDRLAKGSSVTEPQRDYRIDAYEIGRCDYIAGILRSPLGSICCPFEPDTGLALEWARGKLHERGDERVAVEAYALERQRETK